jgi:uncharacterized protein (TIGR02246 family)
MKQWFLRLTAVSILACAPAAQPVLAADDDDHAQDKEAIAKNAERFVEAFHKGNAKEVAEFWTKNGDYTDATGQHLKGREAIEQAFEKYFAEHKGLKLRINSGALSFVTPNVAIEDGVTEVFTPDGAPPSRARYTIVHVKRDGAWHLRSVRDAVFTPPGNHARLEALAWAVGDWAQEGEKGSVERLSLDWAEGQNFLIATFATTSGNVSLASATQWIGWDPVAKHVRSWIFDTDGGFGEGSWKREGKSWVIQTTSTLQDGKKAAATFVMTQMDADTITLQAKDRNIDGKAIPDGAPVTLKRVK